MAVEAGETVPDFDYGNEPEYIIGGDLERANAGVLALNAGDNTLFLTREPIEIAYQLVYQDTLLSKENFEIVSQDNFFDIYADNIFIDWKEDINWFERFIGGLFNAIGNLLNELLDILLGTPIFGIVLEWIVEGIASLFSMTLEEARSALIKVITFIIALYFSIPSGGSSMYAYLEWVSSAFSLSGLLGDAATAKYEDPTQQIVETEEEEATRELENMQHELNLIVGLEEPTLRLNRPEEELRVDGNNHSTYDIFKLD